MDTESFRMQEGNHFLDKAHLVRLCQGDDSKARELAAYAIPVIRGAIERIEQLHQRADDPALMNELHTLKGSIGIIEPEVVYVTVRQLEADYADLNEADKATRCEILVNEVRTLCGELERFNE